MLINKKVLIFNLYYTYMCVGPVTHPLVLKIDQGRY